MLICQQILYSYKYTFTHTSTHTVSAHYTWPCVYVIPPYLSSPLNWQQHANNASKDSMMNVCTYVHMCGCLPAYHVMVDCDVRPIMLYSDLQHKSMNNWSGGVRTQLSVVGRKNWRQVQTELPRIFTLRIKEDCRRVDGLDWGQIGIIRCGWMEVRTCM